MKTNFKLALLIGAFSIFSIGCDGISGLNLAVANAGPDQTEVEATTVTLSGSTTSDSTSIDYKWVEGANTLSTDQTFDKNDFSVGVHVVNLVVTLDAGTADENILKDTVVVSITNGLPNLFTWSDGDHGFEPWKVNGRETPVLFKDVEEGTGSLNVGGFTSFNDKIYFIERHHYTGGHKLRSISADATVLEDIGLNVDDDLVVAGDYLYFATDNNELAVIDTNNITALYTFDNYVRELVADGEKIYFVTNNNDNQNELYMLNQASGNGPIKLYTTSAGEYLGSLTNVNGTIFFRHLFGFGYSNPISLMKTDGSSVNTVKSGFSNSSLRKFTAVNEILYFTARTDDEGTELWRSNGSELGTYMIQDIYTGSQGSRANSSYPKNLVSVNGTLLFTAETKKEASEATQDNRQVRAGSGERDKTERYIWKILSPTGDAFKTKVAIDDNVEEINEMFSLGENVFFTTSIYNDNGTEDEDDDTSSSNIWRMQSPFENKRLVKTFPNQGTETSIFVGSSFYLYSYGNGILKYWLVDDIQVNTETITELLSYDMDPE